MKNNEKRQGVIAGVSLIVMAILAGFSFGYAHSSLVVESPELTLKNLFENKSLFLAEISGWSLIFVADLLVAISLYFFFRNTSKQVSLITALIRIAYTLLLGVAIVQLFKIIPVLNSENAVSDALLIAKTSEHLQLFEKIWSVGLIVFGLHLIGLGYLSVKSASVHAFIGYLLYFGGFSYTLLHSARQLNLSDPGVLNSVEGVLALPMALAEMLLAIWLIYNGVRKSSLKSKSGV